MTASAVASHEARYGKRYYAVDEGYDKRVYTNDCCNWVRIIATMIFFWVFQALHWWGVFAFGINDAWNHTIYQITIFCIDVLFIFWMLYSGKYANKKKRLHTFLQEKIAEKNNEI